MKLINKSRGTGKTMQLIYASAITGFRIIAPNHDMAKHIEEAAKNMGLKIPKPMSDVEYRNRKSDGDHAPVLIDELQNDILEEALELYFNNPIAAATMTVPIDDDCAMTASKPLVYDHETKKVRMKTNRDVFNEAFGHITFKFDRRLYTEDALTIQTEDGRDLKFIDWLDSAYVELKEESDA